MFAMQSSFVAVLLFFAAIQGLVLGLPEPVPSTATEKWDLANASEMSYTGPITVGGPNVLLSGTAEVISLW
jgi:hypothetical protein